MLSRAERNVHDPENAIDQVVSEDIVIEVLVEILVFPSISTGVPVTSVQRIADTLASP